jgi:hypothetical protein
MENQERGVIIFQMILRSLKVNAANDVVVAINLLILDQTVWSSQGKRPQTMRLKNVSGERFLVYHLFGCAKGAEKYILI